MTQFIVKFLLIIVYLYCSFLFFKIIFTKKIDLQYPFKWIKSKVESCIPTTKMTKEQIVCNLKRATFILLLPDHNKKGLPVEIGTAFFISPDGYIITANHVIENKKETDSIILRQPPEAGKPPVLIHDIEIVEKWPKYDLALLKADFYKNKNKDFLKDKKGFDYLEIDLSQHGEGEEIYAYGYPLPKTPTVIEKNGLTVAWQSFSPRLTSANVSSIHNYIGHIITEQDAKYYTIDKSLHYGNSGGPIILQESGKVIAVCTEFQPVIIPQSDGSGITVQSQYTIVSSLKNIENYLKSKFKL